MPPEETVSKSPLDKPLNQLTDDDISQLTREDCRRYLKQKGMRKPSWNKSQAIQQVISLKALLEPDTDAGSRKKLHIPRADTHVQRGKNTYGEPSEPVPDRRNQQDKPDLSNHSTALPVTVVDNSAPSRTIGSADKPVGQMTIFYRGKVNVYDDVPADKAQKIMCLASSPLCMPSETPSNATAAARHSAYCLQAANSKLRLDTVKMSEVSRVPIEESNRLCNDNPGAVESPASRKASVQRYLEKRKER
nr:protein TIFY 4B isoform X2 [Solanum lycopersicum]